MGMSSIFRENSYTYQVSYMNNGVIENEYIDFVQSRQEAISIIKTKYGKNIKIVSARRCNDNGVAVI